MLFSKLLQAAFSNRLVLCILCTSLLFDKAGTSIVIQYVNGKCKVDSSNLRMLTNSSAFDCHPGNVKKYIRLSIVTTAYAKR
ncbi:linear amide C-N hydrolase [Lentisphaerota bacterium]|nr:linear amide C-N hydrolase [Lentisphaerota bacterium]